MPNKRLRQIILVDQKRALNLTDGDIREIERILGLTRDEVVKRLDYLKSVESRYGAYGHNILLREAQGQLDGLHSMWGELSAAIAAVYIAGIERTWSAGVSTAAKFGEHIGVPGGPVSRGALDIIRDNLGNLAGNVSADLERRIRGELMRGILNHDPLNVVADRIVGTGLTTDGTAFKSVVSRAKAIARTETTRAFTQATVARWQDEEAVVGWMWDAVQDMKTCEACAALHGRFWAKGDSSVRFPPLHVNCRCSVLPVTKQYGKYEL